MDDKFTRILIKHYRKSKSRLARQVLIHNHQGAVKHAAAYGPVNILSYEDKVQIGEIVLISVIETGGFDLRFKMKFNTFLISKIKHRIIDEIRKLMKRHKGELIKSVELDPKMETSENLSEKIEQKDLKDKLILEIQRLPRTKQIIMACILNGIAQSEIAEQLDVSQALISQIVNKCKETLRVKLSQ